MSISKIKEKSSKGNEEKAKNEAGECQYRHDNKPSAQRNIMEFQKADDSIRGKHKGRDGEDFNSMFWHAHGCINK